MNFCVNFSHILLKLFLNISASFSLSTINTASNIRRNSNNFNKCTTCLFDNKTVSVIDRLQNELSQANQGIKQNRQIVLKRKTKAEDDDVERVYEYFICKY